MKVNCQKNTHHFYVEDIISGSIVEIPTDSVKPIIYNLYEYQGNLVIAAEYYKALPSKRGKDIIYNKKLGYFLHQKISNVNLNQIVDKISYTELIPNLLYKDKNHIYFFRKEGGCFLCLKILELDPKNIKIYDNEFIGDKKKIYCLYNGNEIVVNSVEEFITYKTSNRKVFGINGNKIYSLCESYNIQEFKDSFYFISKKDMDAIIKLVENK